MAANIPSEASAIAESDLLHQLLENIPDRIYFKDRQSRFIQISPAMARRFGLKDTSEAIGLTDFDVHSPEHAKLAFAEEQEIIRTGQPIIGEVQRFISHDGQVAWASATKMPLRDAKGKIVGTFGITRDLTELKKAQEELEEAHAKLQASYEQLKQMQLQLIEAEKMSSIGRLAYGVAHEIRNPLNILQMGLEFLSGIPASPENAGQEEIVHEMKSAVSRAETVISALMDTTSPSSIHLENCDVRELLNGILAGCEKEALSRGVEIHKEFQADLPAIKIDQAKMEQVFTGIVSNAMDAIVGNGELKVRAQLQQMDRAQTPRDAGDRTAGRVLAGTTALLVEVEDTGPGIPPDALTKVFDPFFTTKATGQGTGLGLTVCRKLVELHGGSIQIENRSDHSGVRVRILLPMTS